MSTRANEQQLARQPLGEISESAPSEAGATVGFDRVDRLPLAVLPAELNEAATATLSATTTALVHEGARGPACHRLLARDITATKTQLRYLQGLRNLAIEQWSKGETSDRRVRMLERLVAGEHRRLMVAIEVLARLGAPPTVVKITAVQAAVAVNGG